MDNALEFYNISKQYRLGALSSNTLRDDLHRFWTMKILRKEDPLLRIGTVNDRTSKDDSKYVWALKDINFEIKQGDVIGIIGRNGAGKSTLLKLLARVTSPTTGEIRVKGRIGSLLEVGTGFHPEMTGKENIFMNGIILGMTKQEVKRKFDEIVDFSGCEKYIDTPVKRYSSGMLVRLAFAVAAHLDPEILVVDEVLAVGDAEFQRKAIGKMHDISNGEGRTVLFVSHNMPIIKQLCKSGIVLHNGNLIHAGTANDCIDFYINQQKVNSINSFDINKDIEYYSSLFHIDQIYIDGRLPEDVDLDKKNYVDISISCICNIEFNIEFIGRLLDENEILIGSFSSQNTKGKTYHTINGKCLINVRIFIPEHIVNGEYYLDIHMLQSNINYLAKIPKLVKLIKNNYISEYTGGRFSSKGTGYFVLDGEELS